MKEGDELFIFLLKVNIWDVTNVTLGPLITRSSSLVTISRLPQRLDNQLDLAGGVVVARWGESKGLEAVGQARRESYPSIERATGGTRGDRGQVELGQLALAIGTDAELGGR